MASAALLLSGCSGDPTVPSASDVSTVSDGAATRIDEAIASAMAQSGSTEAVVGVWGTGDAEYVRGYGDGVNANTKIRGAQATGPVMCALLLDLAEAGSIELDREISKDLTRQSGIEGITYRQLCDMRSGLADFKDGYSTLFTNNPARFWPGQELLAQGFAHSPLKWPGLNVNISDTNLVLLERVLKVKMSQEPSEMLQSHVFSKAGMGSTYYPDLGSTTISGSTLSGLTYPANRKGKVQCDVEPVAVPDVSPSMLSGAGATVTTVTDLKNFYEHFTGGTFGGSSYSSLVTDTIPVKNPKRDAEGQPKTEPDTEGLQWAFGAEKSGPLYGRAGRITGTLTAAYTDPTTGYSVVVALNNSSAGSKFVKRLAFELAAISAEEGFGPELPWSVEDQTKALSKAAICQ
ncbi:CubicO group peptidase (beta-lactamase class C family) [Leucobacter exalbidus]|uniref:CubicO group peptidase (Beta-lactamase class C family) n=1 Tax=Leucobacter exalbidus TaxID=662960 RepID=A0A940PXG4_9MICO|nr:CubicO group peptidase (beta-lactamase class C family) [Leucobacter exalbidus]